MEIDTNGRATTERASPDTDNIAIRVRGLNFYYNHAHQALFDVNMDIHRRRVTAFIGPSGCGKSTLLRCFNRMNEVILNTRIEGDILINGSDIYKEGTRLELLRKRVGMVFQKSNPFPMTIFDNIAFGPRMRGTKDRATLEGIVERSLKLADLWKEVKDRLGKSALDLSGGQQQRLCIARTLANEPDIILMDEPASALDPISTSKIEETIQELRNDYTIVIVTHNLQQAARCSDHTAFFYLGKLVEMDHTSAIFKKAAQKATEDYISGKFG